MSIVSSRSPRLSVDPPSHARSRIGMGQSGAKNGQNGALDPQTVAARVNAFLRGAFPRDTAKQVAAATGLPASTVGKWLVRSSAPSAPALLACCIAFGPAFLSAICPGLGWAEAAVALMRRDALARAMAQAEADARRAVVELGLRL